uniref:Neuronal membrane glycoprotein M6-a n=1 Tax=Myripristis murdjan TaxID=586833 RepID=A0A667WMB2_9TELE
MTDTIIISLSLSLCHCLCLGCKECCERCVGSLPWASLIATVLLYMGVALYCGCGHEALSGTIIILQNYFELIRAPGEVLDIFTIIDILKYIIYGLAAGFFVFGVLLLVEGFFTTGAIRDLYGEFKITACGLNHVRWSICDLIRGFQPSGPWLV